MQSYSFRAEQRAKQVDGNITKQVLAAGFTEGDGTWAGICSVGYLGIAASWCFAYFTAHYQTMVLTALILRADPRFRGFDQTV